MTGGGSGYLNELLAEPGASRTVLDAQVPYSWSALAQLLPNEVTQACSADAARRLAFSALNRALVLADLDTQSIANLFGFACTASLTTDREKRGTLRAHICVQTASSTQLFEVRFKKDRLSRRQQEAKLTSICADSTAIVLGLSSKRPDVDAIETAYTNVSPEMYRLTEPIAIGNHGSVYLPGSFHPLHNGHREMNAVVSKRKNVAVQYELCIANVDKASLDVMELVARQKQFNAEELVITNTPRFVDKATLLGQGGECTFVVGIDTFMRIIDPNYYDGSTFQRNQALEAMREMATRFVVFGRVANGRFLTLADVPVPQSIRPHCEAVSETEFRSDLSSTQLRAQ